MTMRTRRLFFPSHIFMMLLVSFAAFGGWSGAFAQASRPNIIFILADDLGFGDVNALNPRSKIPTPNLDRLAADGMTFTDAHTPSAVCTPTRYGILTGRYCWRSRLKSGVLGGYSPPLIDADRPTVATMLKQHGYYTAGVGKWHLGMDMPTRSGGAKGEKPQDRWDGDGNVDFTRTIANGPITRGFDTYFGVSASLDMAPFVFVADDHFAQPPTAQQPAVPFPAFVRQGPRSADFKLDEVLDTLADHAIKVISERAATGRPFFLYLPFTAPHKPVLPHPRFAGKTDLGPYGDFIVQVDTTVGRVLKAVDDAGIRDNTLLIFTSDNGSFMYRLDAAGAKDHVDQAGIQAFRSDRHTANGVFRGTKADVWEGGHHVAFFARWPGRIKPASTCDTTICLTDLFATAAEVVGAKLGNDAAEDSFSLLPLMQGKAWATPRAPVIHHSAGGMFAIRDGKWKLVLGNGSGGREKPAGKPFAKPFHLFDVAGDVGETTNVAEQNPDVVERLTRKFDVIHDSGRSVERK